MPKLEGEVGLGTMLVGNKILDAPASAISADVHSAP